MARTVSHIKWIRFRSRGVLRRDVFSGTPTTTLNHAGLPEHVVPHGAAAHLLLVGTAPASTGHIALNVKKTTRSNDSCVEPAEGTWTIEGSALAAKLLQQRSYPQCALGGAATRPLAPKALAPNAKNAELRASTKGIAAALARAILQIRLNGWSGEGEESQAEATDEARWQMRAVAEEE